MLTTHRQHLVEGDAELLLGVPAEVSLDEGRSEPVKAGGYGRVGSAVAGG